MKFIRIGENDAKKYDALIKEMPALIKIYSPSCHYCQEMQKDWDALEKDKSLKDYAIAIVEILVDASDEIKSPSGKVTNGIPTIRAVKKNGDKWVDYNGERSTSEMAKFIKQQFISQKRLLNKSSSLKILLNNNQRANVSRGNVRKQKGGKKSKTSKRISSNKRKTSKRIRSNKHKII